MKTKRLTWKVLTRNEDAVANILALAALSEDKVAEVENRLAEQDKLPNKMRKACITKECRRVKRMTAYLCSCCFDPICLMGCAKKICKSCFTKKILLPDYSKEN